MTSNVIYGKFQYPRQSSGTNKLTRFLIYIIDVKIQLYIKKYKELREPYNEGESLGLLSYFLPPYYLKSPVLACPIAYLKESCCLIKKGISGKSKRYLIRSPLRYAPRKMIYVSHDTRS